MPPQIAQPDQTSTTRPLKKWQVVDDAHGGRFMVLGGDGVDENGNRRYKIVRDFTRHLDADGYGSTAIDAERLAKLEANYATNKPHIALSAGDVTPSEVAYLVGSGPSLRKNHKELAKVTRGVVIGVNQTPGILDRNVMHYWFCIDWAIRGDDWMRSMPLTTAILDPTVSPSVVKPENWKQLLWCVPASRSAFYDDVRRDLPHLVRLEHGLNVTFTALCWIVKALKARTIVLVGMDCSFPDGMRHYDEPLWFDRNEEYMVAPDVDGRAVITSRMCLDQAEWHAAVFWFLKDAGVRVINATEGGILTNFVERRPLREVVSELNAQPPAKGNDETRSPIQ